MPLQISCWCGSPESSVLMTSTPMSQAMSTILPVGHRHPALFLGGTGPAVDDDEGGYGDAGLLEGLAVFLLELSGKQRMLVKGVDSRVGGLLDVFVSPFRDLADHVAYAHLLGEHVDVEGDFHCFS